MRIGSIILVLLILSQVCGCTERDTDLEIKAFGRLEDTAPGAWIKVFELSYDKENTGHMKRRIQEKLREKGFVLDRYTENQRRQTTVWFYPNNKLHEEADAILAARNGSEAAVLPRISQSRFEDINEEDRANLIFSDRQIFEKAILEYAALGWLLTIRETVCEDGQTWITLDLGPVGVPWSEVIPQDSLPLKPNRRHECAVVVKSLFDRGVRLFMYGRGERCTRVVLF